MGAIWRAIIGGTGKLRFLHRKRLSRRVMEGASSAPRAHEATSRVELAAFRWLCSGHVPPPFSPPASLPRPVRAGTVCLADHGEPGMDAGSLLRIERYIDDDDDVPCDGYTRPLARAYRSGNAGLCLRPCGRQCAVLPRAGTVACIASKHGMDGRSRDSATASLRTSLATTARLNLRSLHSAEFPADSMRPPCG